MEEDLKLLEEMKNNCLTKRDYIDEKAERKAQAIENLINKYKEQKKERNEIYADYQYLRKENLLLEKENQVVKDANEYWTMRFCEATNRKAEQEKIIELMAEDFKQDDVRSKEEIIEYFRKKAKGE